MRKPISFYVPGARVRAIEGFTYTLFAPYGAIDFSARYSPAEMLREGVFEGKYLNDCENEFPREWFKQSRSRRVTPKDPPDISLNKYGVKSRMSLQEWRRRGWIIGHDSRGWFQWYCRYYIGRRDPAIDAKQIARWRSFKRHKAQLAKAKKEGRVTKTSHLRQKQALLQWSY